MKKELPINAKKVVARLKNKPKVVVRPNEETVSKKDYDELQEVHAEFAIQVGERIRSYEEQVSKLKADIKNNGRTGRWVISSDGYYPYCSECRTEPQMKDRKLPTFCPECGSRNADPKCSVCGIRTKCDKKNLHSKNTKECWVPPHRFYDEV